MLGPLYSVNETVSFTIPPPSSIDPRGRWRPWAILVTLAAEVVK